MAIIRGSGVCNYLKSGEFVMAVQGDMVKGEMFIGARAIVGSGASFHGFDPSANAPLEPAFGTATLADVDQACALAEAAFQSYGATAPLQRAAFLEAIAQNLGHLGETLVARAMAESGLPRMRVEGELGRTMGQLRLFASVLRDGAYLDIRIDPALADRTPPRSDLRLMNRPLGPVVVFGASNFPLAFSVAGGDTASALAAGCPVVVKGHSAHPGTSELVGRAIQQAVASCGLPEGTFSLLFGSGTEIGGALVADARVQAVGFTGSRSGGLALVGIAQARSQPIPVYAEMSSINPVLLLPGALAERGEAIGKGFAGALTLGAGQFCTNPGLLLAIEGPHIADFIAGAAGALGQMAAATMLTPGIHRAYRNGVAALSANARVNQVAAGAPAEGLTSHAALFETSGADFLADHALREEVFGAASLLVRCADEAQLRAVIAALEGQLTIAVHADHADMALAASLLPELQRKAGRVLFGGFGTGVEVCDAMVHGGPFPSTSDGRSTSVGSLAIARFLRPVCYQDVPDALLPPEVQAANPLGLPRRVNGQRQP
jgi:alpha-ketoglutaric semialdehyde dehydrogenase